jgi:hypothetical protein
LTLSSATFACDACTAAAAKVGRRRGVVGFLLPDCLALGERLQPCCLAISLRLLRLRARDVGVRRGDLRLILACIDDEQRLTALTAAPSSNSRFSMMPVTRARTSTSFEPCVCPTYSNVTGKRLQRHRLHGDVGRRKP